MSRGAMGCELERSVEWWGVVERYGGLCGVSWSGVSSGGVWWSAMGCEPE